MAAARRRRRRRPVVPVLLLVVTVFVIGLRVADGSSDDENAELAWLDDIRPVVNDSNQLGLELADLRSGVAALERPAVSRRLDRLAREAQAHLRRAYQIDQPASLREPAALLLSALTVRARSLVAVRGAVDAALGDGPPGEAVDGLERVGRDLVLADRTYELFLDAAPTIARPVTIASRWVTVPRDWERPELAAWVATLRSSRAQGAIHDVAIVTVGIDPPTIGREGDLDVFPMTRNLRLEVVVANVGNEAESRVTIVAAVLRATGESDDARQFVDLAPGQRQVVQLGGLQPPPGEPLRLTVDVEPRAGEASLTDNHYKRGVLFR